LLNNVFPRGYWRLRKRQHHKHKRCKQGGGHKLRTIDVQRPGFKTKNNSKLIFKTYHYLYYCYYNLVSRKGGHRVDAASSALTVFDASIIIALYCFSNIIFGRKYFVPAVEGFGILFLGILLSILNWVYFVKNKNYQIAIENSKDKPKTITLIVGLLLLILPLALFIFSGIKMGNYIRSIK